MRRRTLLSAAGLGAAGLAGCAQFGGTSTPGDATPTGDSDGDATPAGDAAGGDSDTTAPADTPPTAEAFALRSVDAPEITELTEIFTFTLTLENLTDRERTFTSTFSVRREGENWKTSDVPLELQVPAGTTTQWESPRLRLRYLGRVEFRLDALGATWTVEAVENNRDFGVPIDLPGGLQLDVEGVEFADSVATDDGERATPGTDERWMLASVRALNRGGEAIEAPSRSEFTLRLDGGETRSPAGVSPDPAYRGGTLEPGDTRTGDVAFAAPLSTTIHDVTVAWRRAYPNGEMVVSWDK